jgi:Ca2+-binding RTX toxin-like protein
MRKTILVVASVALAMVVAGGVAWAATIRCPNATLPEDPSTRLCFGTDGADTMHGTAKSEWMDGLAGKDTMYGYRSGVNPNGDIGDFMNGGTGSDKIYGGRGKDGVSGGSRNWSNSGISDYRDASTDYVHGGRGNDGLGGGFGQGGVDRLYGEKGDDSFNVAQRYGFKFSNDPGYVVTKEIVDCGPGFDEVRFDKGVDVIKANCERKLAFKRR